VEENNGIEIAILICILRLEKKISSLEIFNIIDVNFWLGFAS